MDLELIYREYHDKVLHYIMGKVNIKEDAEDLCEDVFLKVQKHLDDFDDQKASVSTWIYSIAHNTVIDFYRRRHVMEEIPEELASEEELDEQLLRDEDLRELAEALKLLSEEERDVVILFYYEGLNLREIEKKTGMTYGQVKFRHQSALKEMRKFLSKRSDTGKILAYKKTDKE